MSERQQSKGVDEQASVQELLDAIDRKLFAPPGSLG